MARTLAVLRYEIVHGNLTKDEWILLSQEVNEAIADASEDEIQVFLDSGAGEMLDMICVNLRKEEE